MNGTEYDITAVLVIALFPLEILAVYHFSLLAIILLTCIVALLLIYDSRKTQPGLPWIIKDAIGVLALGSILMWATAIIVRWSKISPYLTDLFFR